MSHTVYLPKENIRFQCEVGETILDAAHKAGYELPSSCRAGVCASCKGKVLSGQVQRKGSSTVLTQSELAEGYALFCQAVPESDVEVEAYGVRPLERGSTTRLTARVSKIARLIDDVSLLQLRFPAGKRVLFKAGQYLQLILADGTRRNYSMANPPHQNDGVQLHIRHVPGGHVSELIQHALQHGDTLEVELPMGEFYLRDSNKPLIFMVSGTGFAPAKSILEAMIRRKEMDRPVRLYWGGRRQQDLYMADLPKRWEQQYPNFNFVPVLSANPEGPWRTGNVHDAVAQDFPDMKEVEVYACGAPAMITAARTQFINYHALPPESFYCDAFAPSGAPAPA